VTLRVLEIAPGGTANLHERWNRLGIYTTEVSFENAVQTITSAGTTELVVDAVVIRQATYASIQLSDQIRSLPDSVAMIDGKKWCSVPIIILASATRERPGEDVLDEEGDVKVRDVVLVEPNDDNNYGADEIKENVEDYRLSVLSEFDNLGFIVKFEHGRYVLGPALKSRHELEGKYYFGPADKRPEGFTTVHRDNFGIQFELEQFEALINRPDVSESQLQEFFEEHPHFLSALHTSLPHVRLPAKNGSILIPDFILRPIVAQERDSKWEVLDLKLPQEKLLAGKGARARLSSSVMKAIRQLRDYHENIQHPDHAEQIETLLGHRLKYPRLGVLIGRLSNTDVQALEREQQYEAGVRIVTYDEILQQQQAQLGG
jgi:hypothetical protein